MSQNKNGKIDESETPAPDATPAPEISDTASAAELAALQREWNSTERWDVGSSVDIEGGPRVGLMIKIDSLARVPRDPDHAILVLTPYAAKTLGTALVVESERAHVDYILLSYMHELEDSAKATRPSPPGLMLQILDEYKVYRANFEAAIYAKDRKEEVSDEQDG